MTDSTHHKRISRSGSPRYVSQIDDSGFLIDATEKDVVIQYDGQQLLLPFDKALILHTLLGTSTLWIYGRLADDAAGRP